MSLQVQDVHGVRVSRLERLSQLGLLRQEETLNPLIMTLPMRDSVGLSSTPTGDNWQFVGIPNANACPIGKSSLLADSTRGRATSDVLQNPWGPCQHLKILIFKVDEASMFQRTNK